MPYVCVMVCLDSGLGRNQLRYKRKVQCIKNQDICIPNICVMVNLDSGLGRDQLRNKQKIQCRALQYATSVNSLTFTEILYALNFSECQ